MFRILVVLALFSVAFAAQSQYDKDAVTRIVTEAINKNIGGAIRPQDSTDFAQLETVCGPGQQALLDQLAEFLRSAMAPENVIQQMLSVYRSVFACFGPMCALLTNPCWSALSTGLSGNPECVPGFTPALIATSCQSGCLGQFDFAARQTVQCLTTSFQGINLGGGGIPTPNFGPVASFSDLLCTQAPINDGVYCLTKISDTSLLVNAANPADPQNCPYFASLGCCATSLLALVGVFNGTVGTCSANTAAFTPVEYLNALTACNLQTVPACPVFGQIVKIAVVHWIIGNIDPAKVMLLTDTQIVQFWNALRADFSAATGIALPLITVANITAGPQTVPASSSKQFEVSDATVSIDVKFIIRASSDLATETNFAAYQTYIAGSSTPAMTNTENYASSQPAGFTTGAVNLDKEASSASVDTQTGGSSSGVAVVVASFSMLFALICVVLAFFN